MNQVSLRTILKLAATLWAFFGPLIGSTDIDVIAANVNVLGASGKQC